MTWKGSSFDSLGQKLCILGMKKVENLEKKIYISVYPFSKIIFFFLATERFFFKQKDLIHILESFSSNISQQLFDYTITFENSQHWNTNSKGVLNVRFKDFWHKKINPTHIWYDKFN